MFDKNNGVQKSRETVPLRMKKEDRLIRTGDSGGAD
jgi:hypothetical protein